MKNIILYLLTFLISLSLVGCNQNTKNDTSFNGTVSLETNGHRYEWEWVKEPQYEFDSVNHETGPLSSGVSDIKYSLDYDAFTVIKDNMYAVVNSNGDYLHEFIGPFENESDMYGITDFEKNHKSNENIIDNESCYFEKNYKAWGLTYGGGSVYHDSIKDTFYTISPYDFRPEEINIYDYENKNGLVFFEKEMNSEESEAGFLLIIIYFLVLLLSFFNSLTILSIISTEPMKANM